MNPQTPHKRRSEQMVRDLLGNMPYLTDGPLMLVRTALRGPDDGFLNEIGWGAAALLIVGAILALASLAWFLVGLFMT
jgi:hypothetical protein